MEDKKVAWFSHPLPYYSPYLHLPSLPEYSGIKENVNPILGAQP